MRVSVWCLCKYVSEVSPVPLAIGHWVRPQAGPFICFLLYLAMWCSFNVRSIRSFDLMSA